MQHCISKNPPLLLLRDGSEMLAGWWLISWHLLWMGFSRQRRGQHFQRPEDSDMWQVGHLSGTFSGTFMYTYPANPCGSPDPQNPGSLWSYLGDSQERNTAIVLTADVGTTQRPSNSLTMLWLQGPLFLPLDWLGNTELRKILTFLTSVRG